MDEQTDGRSRAIFDDEGRFHGHRGGECGEHRTVGHHRAWCFDCQEWCYPGRPCASCERPMLEARAERAEAALREIVDEPEVRDPFGALPNSDPWMLGARSEQKRQQDRARTALESSDG